MNVEDIRKMVKDKKKRDEDEHQKELLEAKKQQAANEKEARLNFEQTFETKVMQCIEIAASKGETETTVRFDNVVAGDLVSEMSVHKLQSLGFNAEREWTSYEIRYSDDTPEVTLSYWIVKVNWK